MLRHRALFIRVATILLEKRRLVRRIEAVSGTHDLDEQQAQSRGNRARGNEIAECFGADSAELVAASELGNTERDRAEHDGNDHHEEQIQKDPAEGRSEIRNEPLEMARGESFTRNELIGDETQDGP